MVIIDPVLNIAEIISADPLSAYTARAQGASVYASPYRFSPFPLSPLPFPHLSIDVSTCCVFLLYCTVLSLLMLSHSIVWPACSAS